MRRRLRVQDPDRYAIHYRPRRWSVRLLVARALRWLNRRLR